MSQLTPAAKQVQAAYPNLVATKRLTPTLTIAQIAKEQGLDFNVAQGALRDLGIR